MRVKRPGRPLSTCPHAKSECTCVTEKVIMIRIPKGHYLRSWEAGSCMLIYSIGSGCHCARAPAYTPGSSRTGETDSPQVAGHSIPLQSAVASTPPPYTSPIQPQSSHPFREPSAGIQPVSYGSAPEYYGHSPRGPSLQTSHSDPIPSNTGLKLQSSTSSNDSVTPHDDMLSESGNRKPESSPGMRIHFNDGYGGPDTSNGGGFISKSSEESPIGSVVATANTSSHNDHKFLGNQIGRPQAASEKTCCCGASREQSSGREADELAQSGKFSTTEEMTQRPSSNHPPSRRLSNHVITSPDERPYSHVPPLSRLSHISHTDAFNIPPSYATAENPLTRRQQAFFQQHGHLHSPPWSYYPQIPPSIIAPSMSGVTHTCTCGPTCQCMFCMAHPYNATTRDRVQALAHMLPDDADYSPKSPLQHSFFSPIDGSSTGLPGANVMHVDENLESSDLSQSRPFRGQNFRNGNYETVPVESGNQTLPSAISSGYLTMEYEYDPIGLGECTDATGTCRCGDDCMCVGCLTHSGHDGEHF